MLKYVLTITFQRPVHKILPVNRVFYNKQSTTSTVFQKQYGKVKRTPEQSFAEDILAAMPEPGFLDGARAVFFTLIRLRISEYSVY